MVENIFDFLYQCESDLMFLSRSQLDRSTPLEFYQTRRSEVWLRNGSAAIPRETRELIPLYRSVALIDAAGKERVVIRDGKLLSRSALHNVSRPADTEFLSENHFRRVRALKRGEIYVSHLTGFHVSPQAQLCGAPTPESAYNGSNYQGVIRWFGAPLFD